MCSGARRARPGAAAGELLTLGLVGVRDEHGHPHVAAELDDELGRGAEVDGALDHAFDPRHPAVGAAASAAVTTSFSGRTTAWQCSPGAEAGAAG